MNIDRRSHIRVNLRLQLFLVCSETPNPIRTETENMSMDGFFFHSAQMLLPGEHLKFLLVLPGVADVLQPARAMYLKGTGQVVHLAVSAGDSGFGIGCRISKYRAFVNFDPSTDEQTFAALTKEDADTHSKPCRVGSP